MPRNQQLLVLLTIKLQVAENRTFFQLDLLFSVIHNWHFLSCLWELRPVVSITIRSSASEVRTRFATMTICYILVYSVFVML